MAPRFSRRRDADEPPGAGDADDEDVDLSAAEHAWWAQRDINDAWTPHARLDPPPPPEPERDVLAEHLGADWRAEFGFDPVLDAPRQMPHEQDRKIESDPVPAPGPAPAPAPEAERERPDAHEPSDAHEPDPPSDGSDPYAVLGVEPSASWDDIVDAHRRQARRHHPDQLFGRPEAEIAAAEERIRDINVAYQELRIRRGK